MIQKQATAQQTLDVIGDFLSQIRSEKEAETVSYKDKPEATPTEQSKPKASEGQVSQTSLGKEQTQAADDSNSTVDSTPANSDDKGKKPVDDQGPKTLDTDQPIAEDGNIGPMRKQEITQEQKMARAARLGNAVLTKLAEELGAMGETTDEPPKEKTAEDGDEVDVDDDEENKEAADAADEFLNSCLQKSAAYAQNAHDSFLLGMLKRAQDEAELAGADFEQLGITPDLLAKMGGASGLLDKVAQENPMAVMPEGYDMEMPGGEMPGMEAGMGAGMPAEEAGMTEEDLAGLADALAEAGVAPEAIDEAAEAVEQLAEAGVSPEEAAEAIREVVDESLAGGEGAGEVEGEIEEAAEEAPMESEVPKEASDKEARERVSAAANFLREKLA
jgi:hypothetical protein